MDTPQAKISLLFSQLNTIIAGKDLQVRDCVTCLLAGGHLLIEDTPGVGKTTLAHALARTFGLEFSRVQFTSDLMPSDLTGVSVFEPGNQDFVFHPGPLFTQLLLADEINRASPRTQSALLEAMEEQQVTVDGRSRPLPRPFFVIATQNPNDQLGTHPLPESQLDRFLMRVQLGYPGREAERELLQGQDRRELLSTLPPVLDAAGLASLQQSVRLIRVSDAVLEYLQDLLDATRSGQWFVQGLSPRAGLAILRAAQAHALIAGRSYVAPDDIAAILPQAASHRLITPHDSGRSSAQQILALLAATPLR